MFNVTVLRLKDIKKYLVGILFTIILIIIATKFFSPKKENTIKTENKIETIVSKQIQNIENHMLKSGISQTIPTISNINEEDETESMEVKEIERNNILESILTSEINVMKQLEKSKENNIDNEENQKENNRNRRNKSNQ